MPPFYLACPECRHIATKSRMYRNIILDAHLIDPKRQLPISSSTKNR